MRFLRFKFRERSFWDGHFLPFAGVHFILGAHFHICMESYHEAEAALGFGGYYRDSYYCGHFHVFRFITLRYNGVVMRCSMRSQIWFFYSLLAKPIIDAGFEYEKEI